MARPNGTNSKGTTLRRQLIQPVLPALPLLPKAKKEPVKIQEADHPVINGAATESHGAVESETNSQPSTSIISDTANKDVEQTSTSASAASQTSSAVEQPEAVDLGSADKGKIFFQMFCVFGLTNVAPTENDVVQGHAATYSEDDHNAVALSHPEASPSLQSSSDEVIANIETPAHPVHEKSASPKLSHENEEQITTTRNDVQALEPDLTVSSGDPHDARVMHDGQGQPPPQHSIASSVSYSSTPQVPDTATSTHPPSDTAENVTTQIPLPVSELPTLNAAGNGLTTMSIHPEFQNGAVRAPAGPQGFPTVLDYIRGLQYNPDWYDCDLCVYYPQSNKPSIYRQTHSLVLLRSERLRNFIYQQRASFSYYVVNLAPVRPIDANAFDAALRFLYADTIISAERLFPNPSKLDKSGKARAFDYVMSYLVAGLELGLEPVVTRALDLVGRLLDWDTAELAVKEASLLLSSSVPAVNPLAPQDSMLAARSIFQHVFELIILRLDVKSFKLDTESISADLPSRLAQLEGSRAVNPALANMVFGSMPASTNLSPVLTAGEFSQTEASPDTTASVIMLNLDFEDLCDLARRLKSLYNEAGIRIITEVVEERERRRLSILNNRSVPSKHRMANSTTWDVIGWREYVSDGVLRRERVGFIPNKRVGNN